MYTMWIKPKAINKLIQVMATSQTIILVYRLIRKWRFDLILILIDVAIRLNLNSWVDRF